MPDWALAGKTWFQYQTLQRTLGPPGFDHLIRLLLVFSDLLQAQASSTLCVPMVDLGAKSQQIYPSIVYSVAEASGLTITFTQGICQVPQ